MENGGILPNWIQILLLAALNILPGELLFSFQTHQKDVNSFVNMVPCVSIKGAQNCQVQYTKKKGNNSAEKEDFLSLSLSLSVSLFSFPLARNKENGNRESRILIGYAPCTIIPVYTLPAARKRLL